MPRANQIKDLIQTKEPDRGKESREESSVARIPRGSFGGKATKKWKLQSGASDDEQKAKGF